MFLFNTLFSSVKLLAVNLYAFPLTPKNLAFLVSLIYSIFMGIIAIVLFISSFLSYVDYEYELFQDTITISKIYNEEEKALIQYLKAPQQQLLFDAALYKEFLKNGDSPLYLSNTQTEY